MIKRKQTKKKSKKRKNPKNWNIEQILKEFDKNVEINRIASGTEADAYLVNLKKQSFIFNIILKSGKYILKFYYPEGRRGFLDKNQINYLTILSNYGLIPKIYYIDSNIIIMKYINGTPLIDLMQDATFYNNNKNTIKQKINHLVDIWSKLGFEHKDLVWQNILYTDSGKLYLIDPGLNNEYPSFI